MKTKKLPPNCVRILAALVKIGNGSLIVKASKAEILEHVSLAETYHPLKILIEKGYIRKVGEGERGANIYKILKVIE